MKKALITGITGQIGSYMAEYLLERDYQVDGLDRRKSSNNYGNLKKCINDINIIEGDIVDSYSIHSIVKNGQYDEIYNLCAQSHVKTSFEQPVLTHEINTIGVLNLLEAIRSHSKHSKMYQASTSEMFGSSRPPQNEYTHFNPRSPYGCAKLASHHLVSIYRDGYNLKLACGIMFNSESPRRGITFLPQKIVQGVKKYRDCLDSGTALPILELGNLDARRDWSHAKDSVAAIYRICNQLCYRGYNLINEADNKYRDYVFGSGHSYSVRDFLQKTLDYVFGIHRFKFEGTGLEEKVIDTKNGNTVVTINKDFFRPAEVDYLLADPTTIKEELMWNPQYSFDQLIKDMVDGE